MGNILVEDGDEMDVGQVFGDDANRPNPPSAAGRLWRILNKEPEPAKETRSVILECLGISADDCEVSFFPALGRAFVVVPVVKHEWRAGAALSRRASQESNWEIAVITATDLDQLRRNAAAHFALMKSLNRELRTLLIDHGCLSLADLSIMEPDWLVRHGHLDLDQVHAILDEAEALDEGKSV